MVPASEAGLWDEKERRGERYVGAMERGSDLEWGERGKLGLVLDLHPRLAYRRSRATVGRANVLSRTLPRIDYVATCKKSTATL